MTDYVKVSGKRVVINAKLLRYNPYRVDMSRTCAVCGAPPSAFCVPSMHREPRP